MGDYPPPEHVSSYYYDFAYEKKGPFRMANGCIGDTAAKSFAEYILSWSTSLLRRRYTDFISTVDSSLDL